MKLHVEAFGCGSSTIEMMFEGQTGDEAAFDPANISGLADKFGFGLAPYGEQHPLAELQGAYAWFGFWATSFRVSPKGGWVLVTMSQLAWDENSTPKWFAEYESIAAEAITD